MASEGMASEWLMQLRVDIVKESTPGQDRPILRAPADLRRISPQDFQPQCLHLGLHNRKPYSARSEEFKVAVAHALMQDRGLANSQEEWDKLVKQVVSSPVNARKQYEEEPGDLDSGQGLPGSSYMAITAQDADADAVVANMLTLDALFVVAYLQVARGECALGKVNDNFQGNARLRGLMPRMEAELAMLQNQVPMSCLKAAVRVMMRPGMFEPTDEEVTPELEHVLRYAVSRLYPLAVHDPERLLVDLAAKYTGAESLAKCSHILDCLYCVFSETSVQQQQPDEVAPVPPPAPLAPVHHVAPPPGGSGESVDHAAMEVEQLVRGPVMSAKNLKLRGVKIQCNPYPFKISDIRLENRRGLSDSLLLLPQLEVHDTTAGELRNLAVHEMLAYPWNGHVRKYMRFMNDLIASTEDAHLLVRSGAVVNRIGGFDAMAGFWSRLNEGIPLADLARMPLEIAEDAVRMHCEKKAQGWSADVRAKVCGKPTLVFATLFSLTLLVLTLLQTVHSYRNSK